MLSLIKVSLVLLSLFNICRTLDIQFNLPYNASDEFGGTKLYDCPQFFHGMPWPRPKGDLQKLAVVRLCQTQVDNGQIGKQLFASAFSMLERIPLYSANRVVLKRGGQTYPKPSENHWDRVASTLCDLASVPQNVLPSHLHWEDEAFLPTCTPYQAISDDYIGNGMGLDRGHLSPCAINKQDKEKIRGSFTLTNAAPQYYLFNQNSWRQYECVTKQTILDFAPEEPVYVITGTTGTQGWMNQNTPTKSLVKIPKYFYKVVCYPGSSVSAPWGYAIVKENVNRNEKADYQSYMKIKDFQKTYFEDPLFGTVCMNADFGVFASIFPRWDDYLRTRCPLSRLNEEDC